MADGCDARGLLRVGGTVKHNHWGWLVAVVAAGVELATKACAEPAAVALDNAPIVLANATFAEATWLADDQQSGAAVVAMVPCAVHCRRFRASCATH